MRHPLRAWDYLIVTASSRQQASAYERELRLRQELGLLAETRKTIVVADPGGKRIGSGGSTVHSLLTVLNQETADLTDQEKAEPGIWLEILEGLRVLIIHAGGDSRRLPAYAPAGKIFIPVPGESDRALTTTLFDRQLPTYLALPGNARPGQVVITAGDVLLSFDPAQVVFKHGVTGLGCYSSPEEAAGHGVYSPDATGQVRRYLQKPQIEEQAATGAIDRYRRTILDIGVLSLDGDTALRFLQIFGIGYRRGTGLSWNQSWQKIMVGQGLDVYREICCAMGKETTLDGYLRATRSSGSSFGDQLLTNLYSTLSPVPFHVQILAQCNFLHFGTTREIIESGQELDRRDSGVVRASLCLSINNQVNEGAGLIGTNAWVEGCRISAPLRLAGDNVVTGLDVTEPLELSSGQCLDVIQGRDESDEAIWFIRCYSVFDSFKGRVADATFCGLPLPEWLKEAGAEASEICPAGIPADQQSVWTARLFPGERAPEHYTDWLWMFEPARADAAMRDKWRSRRRYSLAEIADSTDFEAFFQRRADLRFDELLRSLASLFRTESGFSAAEMAMIMRSTHRRLPWIQALITEARWHHGSCEHASGHSFTFSRLLHSLASSIERIATSARDPLALLVPGLLENLSELDREWLGSMGILPNHETSVGQWASGLRAGAFNQLGCAIIFAGAERPPAPRNALRTDEIIWGRAPARLDLGGGWTDTPPYSLEFGGSVINAAINLNGQPPIQCYARVIESPVIRISSIDLGSRIEIRSLQSLLDYGEPTSEFGLAKAALALAGFAPDAAEWGNESSLSEMLESFGGGIELTTLAAIPKGSGLGTSSIISAVVLSVIHRLLGRDLSRRDLFHSVLRLEQALTTGGGWQDQVGGVVDGVKLVESEAGMIPDLRIHYVPPDVLDPRTNGGMTCLYYTGITRLAKNILQDVVGRYLDRDRVAMVTLRQLHRLGAQVSEAMSRKDVTAFGQLIEAAWTLNKQLDPHSSNDEIERLLSRLKPSLLGAKLLGAGGGGFLLMVCKSPEDALAVRKTLEQEPPNPRARFFDFTVSTEGLVVSVC
jgi:fucokinase